MGRNDKQNAIQFHSYPRIPSWFAIYKLQYFIPSAIGKIEEPKVFIFRSCYRCTLALTKGIFISRKGVQR